MGMLPTYLELAYADNSEREKIVKNKIPKELTAYNHGEVVRPRELLLTESLESTTLVQAEVMDTILRGAQAQKCMRDAVNVVNTSSNSFNWILGESAGYAQEVAEGGQIPEDVSDYTKRSFDIKKFGVRPVISNDLISDGLFDVIEHELFIAGQKMENKLNRDMLDILLDNAGQEHDTTGSNQGIDAMIAARKELQKNDYMPTDLIMHPEMEAMILSDFVPSDYHAGESMVEEGSAAGSLLGVDLYRCSVSESTGSYTWGYASDGEIGGLMLNKESAGAIGMRRDIQVEQYDDPIRDLTGMAVTMRYAVNYLRADAICRIEY